MIKFEDGEFSLDVNVSPDEDTVWLTQNDMATLFDVDRTRITRHINNIFDDFELGHKNNVRKTHFPFSDKTITLYNLEVIIAVGCRAYIFYHLLIPTALNNKKRPFSRSV